MGETIACPIPDCPWTGDLMNWHSHVRMKAKWEDGDGPHAVLFDVEELPNLEDSMREAGVADPDPDPDDQEDDADVADEPVSIDPEPDDQEDEEDIDWRPLDPEDDVEAAFLEDGFEKVEVNPDKDVHALELA